MSKKIALLFIYFIASFSFAQEKFPLLAKDTIAQNKWVDSVFNQLSLQEKVAQLMMVAAYSNKDKSHEQQIENLVEKNRIGGLIFMQGTPSKQLLLTNKYQSISKTPLFIGQDAEWGLSMRLKNTFSFPWNMTLGAVRNSNLIYQFGVELGKQCRRIGVNINFAPVVDININPKNPIIGNRSFGEDRDEVTQKAQAFINGLQSQQVLACAKHFPGHGDTEADSHKSLPFLNFNRKRLDSIELYPYKSLIKNNLASIMVAHLNVPALETALNTPTSLSKNVVTNLLKNELNFKGLVITDALNMKGAGLEQKPGEIELKAFLAGNDILLFPNNVEAGIQLIKEQVTKNEELENQLNTSVKKILKAKYWAQLNNYHYLKTDNILPDLNNTQSNLLNRKLIEHSITLVKNKNNLVPFKNLENLKIAYVKLGNDNGQTFYNYLNKYTQVDEVSATNLDELIGKLKHYNLVIVGFHKSNKNPWKSYRFSNKDLVWLQEIARTNKVLLSVFASPYSLLQIKTFENVEGVVVAYQNSKIAQQITAQGLFGALSIQGKLPVSIRNEFLKGSGFITTLLNRLAYSIPEAEGLDSNQLEKIDSVAKIVIEKKMAPGMQILVARNKTVVYQKSFGYFTYNKEHKVNNNDVYDIASLTKITATLPLIMELYNQKKIDLNTTLGTLLPNLLQKTNKDTLTIKQVLSHVGRLKAWIPFYLKTLDSVTKKPSKKYYRTAFSNKFSVKVAKNLYLRTDYKDSIYAQIAASELREKPGYKYSDLSYYLFKKYLEKYYKNNLSEIIKKHFYLPLGANKTGFLPLKLLKKSTIVPTEKDTYYRNQVLQGYVHDMGAAMLGGIGGHAGIFSNSNDLAKIMQMYLNGGKYGGKTYFSSSTMKAFNYQYYAQDSVRRGVGFDKPQLKEIEKATCGCVSNKSFGHSGFTGTYAWADPETQIIYIFLSNRVYPTMENKKLVKNDIRTKIQEIIQESIKN
ncbi:MAG: glycoside hydrolase family 3 N-terminal domain-containing protein [Lutibacter sp.]